MFTQPSDCDLGGQGSTLRCSKTTRHSVYFQLLSLENSLCSSLSAGKKSKIPPSKMDLPYQKYCNMKEISQANSLCSRRKQPKAQMK